MSQIRGAARFCLPRPEPTLVSSSSRRVRARHGTHFGFLTQTVAALNILGQNVGVSAVPFPECDSSALAQRDLAFISDRIHHFLDDCRVGGGVDIRPSQVADFAPVFSSMEFINSPVSSSPGQPDLSSPGVSPSSSSHQHDPAPAVSTPQPASLELGSPSQPVQVAPVHAAPSASLTALLGGMGPYGVRPDLASPAMEVDADKVSLPAAAAVCDVLRFLPADMAARYASPDALLKPSHEVSAERSAFLVRDGHYARLLRRMDACGMLAWTDQRPLAVNGLFAVAKPDGTQRLILDARRANALFVEPDHVALPTPDLVAGLEVPHGSKLFVAKADLSDFYHCLRLPEFFGRYFGLPPVSPDSVGHSDRFPHAGCVWPLLRTLPMGWSHSVLVAQHFHLGFIAQRVPLLRRADMISLGNDLRVDRLRWSLYIDDLTIFGLSAADGDAALDQYSEACPRERLVVKPAKLQRSILRGGEVMGLRVDGSGVSIGVAPHKLALLSKQTLMLARAPVVDAHELSSLVGKWVWSVLVRRPVLAVFGAVYRWLQAYDGRSAPLWPSARLELAVLCALAPLLVANLSAPWFGDAVAVDASSDGQGVVAARLPRPLFAGLAAAAGLPPADAFRADDVFDAAMRTALERRRGVMDSPTLHEQIGLANWRVIVSKRWRRPEHINCLEATALRTGVRWARSHPSAVDCRLLVISDSAVVVSATAKGRSSSPALLANCRFTAALLLSAGLRLSVRWVPRPRIRLIMPRGRSNFFLLAAKVKDSTRQRYREAVDEFISWCDDNRIRADSNDDLDWALLEYIHNEYERRDGAGRTRLAHVMAGVQLFAPPLRGKLPMSAQALLGWKRLHPGQRHPPLTWELTVAIATQLAKWGRFDMAVGTLLAFASLLRIGELVGLLVEDLLDAQSDDPRVDVRTKSGVRLRTTKTADNLFADLYNDDVLVLLRQLVAHKRAKDRMFDFSASSFRDWFKRAAFVLGLDERYVPHSLRHGGATALYMSGVPIETILHRGRWATTKSARYYVQSGKAMLLGRNPYRRARDLGRAAGAMLVPFLLRLRRRHGLPLRAAPRSCA